jgi:hypothetical protein
MTTKTEGLRRKRITSAVDLSATVPSPSLEGRSANNLPSSKGYGALYVAKPKRVTIRDLEAEMVRLREHMAKLNRRLANRGNRPTKVYEDLLERDRSRFKELTAKLEDMGALVIHEPKPKALPSVRPQGIRLHPERKAGPVRRITEEN